MAKQNMGLTLNQEIFIGITFIVIIIIMIIIKDKIMAILIVGLVANFLAISSQLILINDRHLQNQPGKNGFENSDLPSSDFSQTRDPLIIEQFKHGYDLYREPCTISKTSDGIVQPVKNGYDSYEGKIDGHDIHNNEIIDTNSLGYDADVRVVREQIIRNDNDRVNPVRQDRKLIKKYVLPEIIEEEYKPWWG